MAKKITPQCIADAHARIAPYVNHTPLLESSLLNGWLGHRIIFKAESFQKVGAFKCRGALNALLHLKERGKLPQHVVTYSSGNHAQALAYSAQLLGVKSTIFIPKSAAAVKRQAAEHYGAEVVLTDTREQAEDGVVDYVARGSVLIPPYDSDDIISGQGTACYEALRDGVKPDVIFAPCGGGGLLSGTYLAAQLLEPGAAVYGAEPKLANDAAESLRRGSVFRLSESPPTIADGARTLAVSERTLAYLQRLDGFIEVEEADICYWTQWLCHLLKTVVEPTSAVAMAGLTQWLAKQLSPQTCLVILSGGNIAAETYREIWATDHLQKIPHLRR